MARPKGRGIEKRRRLREEERAAARTSATRRKTLLWALVAVVMIGGAALYVLTRPTPEALEDIETFPDQGRAHVQSPEAAPEYNSDPPTSGPHAPAPAACGVYTEPVSDLAQVHTLEHGAVIVQYDSSLPEDQVRRLQELARRLGDHILVAPRQGMPAPVAVTAWTYRMLLEEVDTAAIQAFYHRYARQGPERAACPFQVDQAAGS